MNQQTRKNNLLYFFISFFAATFVTTSMYNTITIDAGPWLTFTLGSFIFMFAKSVLDIIQEFWGRKERKRLVLIAMVLKILFFGISCAALAVGDASPGAQEFLGSAVRVMFAGLLTLFIGQYFLDPYLYSVVAKVMKGRSPFLRGAFSNVIGSILMSPIQAFVAFYGFRPTEDVMRIAFGKIALKLPAIFIASAVAAIVIYFLTKKLGMKSMVETKGQDHN